MVDFLLPPAASLLIKLVALTLKLEMVGREHLDQLRGQKQSVLFAFWHNRLLFVCYFLRRENLTMMISQSRDGELIARVARHFGIGSMRGSSSRGGLRAVAELAGIMTEGRNGGITPDGPRGPKYEVQIGALLAAKKAGAPILPVSINFSRKKIFNSWDRFRFPLPFARAVLVFGEPLAVPEHARGETLERLRVELEGRLKQVTEQSDRHFDVD
jgi:lysophospholipid acyltransferase (LPLAT)-like uncharacterized protein